MLTLYTLPCGESVMCPENVKGKVEENEVSGRERRRDGKMLGKCSKLALVLAVSPSTLPPRIPSLASDALTCCTKDRFVINYLLLTDY